MAKNQTKPEVASGWPGFPAAAEAVPLGGIGSFVEAATQLAEPDSHAAPTGIGELTGAAKALAPPDTPVGGGAEDDGAAGDFAITEDGVPLGAGAEHAMDVVDQANSAAELDMALVDDVVFLTTVGINSLPDVALGHV